MTTTRVKTVYDEEPEELAESLRDAAEAVEEGFATMFMEDRHGDVDDGPIYHTLVVKYVELMTDE